MICSRCKVIMYPGPSKSPQNHKRGFCSDGCPVTLKRFKTETNDPQDFHPPPYPQPEGIFSEGETFRLTRFIHAINDVYERIVLQNGSNAASGIAIEDQMFIQMLQARTVQLPDGQNIFRLYPGLRLDHAPSYLLVDYDGARYLRMPMIADTEVPPGPAE